VNEAEEKIFERGSRAVYRELLGVALRGLGVADAPNDPFAAQRRIGALESEDADARAQLRILCKDFGDNDWEDDDHLGDVIDKHLGKHLHRKESKAIDLLRRVRAEQIRLRREPEPVDAEIDAFLARYG
jgi:hypothetical protein